MTGRHAPPAVPGPEKTPYQSGAEPSGSTAVREPDRQSAPREASGLTPFLLVVTNVILLVLLAFVLTHRPTYEYQTVSPSDSSFDETMNGLGAQGWKTESCRRATSDSGFGPLASYECIMSRPGRGW